MYPADGLNPGGCHFRSKERRYRSMHQGTFYGTPSTTVVEHHAINFRVHGPVEWRQDTPNPIKYCSQCGIIIL